MKIGYFDWREPKSVSGIMDCDEPKNKGVMIYERKTDWLGVSLQSLWQLAPRSGDYLYYPFYDILCPIDNKIKTYHASNFTLVDGKAEWKRKSFYKKDA